MATLVGQSSIKGSSEAVRFILLTFCSIGITFTWGVEMTYCTPYLLSLGLSKSNTSLVWVAGPLSGLIVQPVIGVLSDESTSRWGRRRPMMVIGTVIVAVVLLVLGFTKELVQLVIADVEAAKRPTIVLAVLSIYVVDFAINVVMSTSRSLIVDILPIEKQQAGAAWASRMSAVGHIIGYGGGAVDLVKVLGPTLGDTQFKQLSVIAVVTILVTTGVTCWAVTERVLVDNDASKKDGSRFKVVKQIYSTLLHLPPRIQAICWAQFWQWIGWFPFLFYSTTWVGETYFRYDAPDTGKSDDVLGDMGRIGSQAFVIYSLITFTGAIVFPMLVQSPEDENFTPRPPAAIAGLVRHFSWSKPDLLSTWIFGQLLFAVTMSMAPFATTFRFATALVCICGVPWAIATWAPSAFLGVEVNKLAEESGGYRRLSNIEMELPSLNEQGLLGDGDSGAPGAPAASSAGELSGIYFGILNIYTTLPQFVGTFISMIVFAVLEPGKSRELGGEEDTQPSVTGPNAISVCLFIGAMSTVVASFMTRKLRTL